MRRNKMKSELEATDSMTAVMAEELGPSISSLTFTININEKR